MATHLSVTEAQRRALGAFVKLRRAANALAARESALFRAAGLTDSRFGVLEALLHLGPLHQNELAAKLLKSSANLTTVVDNLEREGLVERRRSAADGRVVEVHLTPVGRQRIADLFPRVVEHIEHEMSVLDPDEQDQLARLCRRVGLGEGSE